ncbi:MAG: UPF0149 family protein [Betaproteobacteria bacterium]
MTPTDNDRPLHDDDIAALDELLATIPEERDPLDVAMLDGFLVGVLLQPEPVAPATWLPYVFDAEGSAAAMPDVAARNTATALIMRRHDELAACITGREPIDPIVFELEDDAGAVIPGKAGIAALAPWVMGFTTALGTFPSLQAAYDRDDELAAAMVGILRHLPLAPDADAADSAEYAERRAQMERDAPLADLDDAIDELAACVLDAAMITRPNRPLMREAPKVGRNDPCPCGSGRKYKACHGKDA